MISESSGCDQEEDVLPVFEQHWQDTNENYEKLDEYSTTVGGVPARTVIFSAEREGVKQKAKFVLFVRGTTLYRISTGFPVELYDAYVGYYDLVVRTFKFL